MNHPRGTLTAEIPRKRKERERENFFLPPSSLKKGSNNHYVRGKQVQVQNPNTTSLKARPGEPVWSNRLLAGYMAHEFLTQGTLLGEKFDPARAQAVPLTAESKATAPAEPSGATPKGKSYAEVASLLKKEGAHIPGIVNPTQLARWIQMRQDRSTWQA